MRLILLVAIVAGLLHACSCMPPGTPAEELAKSDAVFSGTVTSMAKDSSGYTATFAVERAWKGVETSAVKVHTADNSAACGYGFSTGEKYLVYAYSDDRGALSTGLCSRTARLAEAKADLDALGQGTVFAPQGAGTDYGMLTAILMVVIGVALLAYVAIKKK